MSNTHEPACLPRTDTALVIEVELDHTRLPAGRYRSRPVAKARCPVSGVM